MLRRIAMAIGLLLLLIPLTLRAESVSYTLEKAISRAKEKNKRLSGYEADIKVAQEQAESSYYRQFPSLKFSSYYRRTSETEPFNIILDTPAGPVQKTLVPSIVNNYGMRLTLDQPLFTGFKLQNARKIAEIEVTANESAQATELVDVVYRVKLAFYNLRKLQETEKSLSQILGQLKEHRRIVENFLAQGMAINSDLLKIDVRISEISIALIDVQNGIRIAKQSLLLSIGDDLAQDVEIVWQESPTRELVAPTRAEVLARARQKRPEFTTLQQRLAQTKLSEKIADAGYWPTLLLNANYDYARPNPKIFPATDEFNDSWDVSLLLAMTLWDWNQPKYDREIARARARKIENQLSQLNDGVAFEVEAARLSLEKTISKITAVEVSVHQNEENLREVSERFKNGLATSTDVLDAETDLLKARIEQTQSVIDGYLAQAALNKAIGEE